MDVEQMFEAIRQHAKARGKDVTIHTNPDADDRPAWYGLVCVHPLSDDRVGYSADTLTGALEAAYAAVAFEEAVDATARKLGPFERTHRFDRGRRDPEGGSW